MGDWGQPSLPDEYPAFQDRLKARDVDCGTLFLVDPVNPPVGIIRFNRSLNLFQEWNGSTWINKIISQAGGGTGSGSLPALGTMASQNANNVNITGGNMQGMSTVYANGEIRGATHLRINGQFVIGSSQIVLTDAVGKIPNITSGYFSALQGHEITNLNGSAIDRGSVNGAFLGSGFTNTGTKVLMDNGTWVEKNLVGGGGVIEVVHAYLDFPFNVFDFGPIAIPWTKGAPASASEVEITVNNAGFAGTASVGTMQMSNWYLVDANSFIAQRVHTPGFGSGAPNEFRIYYQAIHYKITP